MADEPSVRPTSTANDDAFLTRSALLAFAAREGESVSPAQLDRWRKAGLLPTPVLRGRGQGLGMEARYPASAGAQLVRIARELRTTRDVDAVRWRLWWKGEAIEASVIRRYLTAALNATHELAALVDRMDADDSEADAASKRFERSTRQRSRDAAYARLRRSIGLHEHVGFALLLAQAFAGRYDGHSPEDFPRLGGLLGFSDDGQRGFFSALSHMVNLVRANATDLLRDDSEMLAARDQMRPLAMLVQSVLRDAALRTTLGVKATDGVRDLAASEPTNVLPPLVFLLWLGYRRHPHYAEILRSHGAFLGAFGIRLTLPITHNEP